jgi:hypothetical protein
MYIYSYTIVAVPPSEMKERGTLKILCVMRCCPCCVRGPLEGINDFYRGSACSTWTFVVYERERARERERERERQREKERGGERECVCMRGPLEKRLLINDSYRCAPCCTWTFVVCVCVCVRVREIKCVCVCE